MTFLSDQKEAKFSINCNNSSIKKNLNFIIPNSNVFLLYKTLKLFSVLYSNMKKRIVNSFIKLDGQQTTISPS